MGVKGLAVTKLFRPDEPEELEEMIIGDIRGEGAGSTFVGIGGRHRLGGGRGHCADSGDVGDGARWGFSSFIGGLRYGGVCSGRRAAGAAEVGNRGWFPISTSSCFFIGFAISGMDFDLPNCGVANTAG